MIELLPIPIQPARFVADILGPAMALLPKHMDTPQARVQITATCLQESAFDSPHGSRWQVVDAKRRDVKGPARGLAQFERGTSATRGGVWGVYLHSASARMLGDLCRARDVRFDPRDIWAALDTDDILAVALARLLLWTDPKPLPAAQLDACPEAFALYLRVWRPGAWDRGGAMEREALRNKWRANWGKALAANEVKA